MIRSFKRNTQKGQGVVEFAMIGGLFFGLLIVLGVIFIEVFTWNEWHYSALTGARAGSAPNATQNITEAAAAAAMRTIYHGETIVSCTPPWPGSGTTSPNPVCPYATTAPASWSTNSPSCSTAANPTECYETNPANAIALCPTLGTNILVGQIVICAPPDTVACGPSSTPQCSPNSSITSNGTDSVVVEGWIQSPVPNPFTGNSYLPARAVDTETLQEVQCDATSTSCAHP